MFRSKIMAPGLIADMARVVLTVEDMEAAVEVVAVAAKVEAPALDMATAPVVASEMDTTELTSMARRDSNTTV
jgi:hypothetical protein